MSAAASKLPQLFTIEDVPSSVKPDTSGTFSKNMSLPLHSWFRYTAGFSAEWVREVLKKEIANGRSHVLDPFAGSGTVPLEAEFFGISSIGLEAHPYVHRIANAKLNWQMNTVIFLEAASEVLKAARKTTVDTTACPVLIQKCYTPENAAKLYALKEAFVQADLPENSKSLIWFTITSILRPCSHVGTAQWQYVLPEKTKAKVLDPFFAYETKIVSMRADMMKMQRSVIDPGNAKINFDDARHITTVPNGWADLVITSPPYANNYDYADALRLEMTFWGDIKGWSDLQDTVRQNLIRACTQHVAKHQTEIEQYLDHPDLTTIRHELVEIYHKLKMERLSHGGKKQYNTMILAYFRDLSNVFQSLRRVTAHNALMCFVIGDSAPYGIYVPVDRWLGQLAVAAGFSDFQFEKLRDRNTKWKNRKHTVPLQEGRLWIKG